jgi:hypothetical protein
VRGLIDAEESTYEELALLVGKTSEERVHDVGFLAESEPSTPGAISVFVRLRLDRVMDDSVVCKTSSTKDKISS